MSQITPDWIRYTSETPNVPIHRRVHHSTADFVPPPAVPLQIDLADLHCLFPYCVSDKVEHCLYNWFILSVLFQGHSINISRKRTLIKRLLDKQNCLLGQSLEGLLCS